MIRDKYPLLLINELVDKVKKVKRITKLDLRWGYYNVCIHEGDEHKAAFHINMGLFEPMVMFFGLCNMPAIFQAFINRIFAELLAEGVIIMYLNNIMIFSDSDEEHEWNSR